MRGSLQKKGGKYYAVFRVNKKQKWINLYIDAKKGNKRCLIKLTLWDT